MTTPKTAVTKPTHTQTHTDKYIMFVGYIVASCPVVISQGPVIVELAPPCSVAYDNSILKCI